MEQAMYAEAFERTTAADFKEVPSSLMALGSTIDTLEQEYRELTDRLAGVLTPASDEKMAEELRIGPSSELAQTLSAFEQRVARIRNGIYDLNRRVQL